jgi:hypothetical protein
MKNLVLILLSGLFALSSKAQSDTTKQQFRSGVLVEFFTSEGCSSCPEADEFATKIRQIADSNNLPVHTLDWHVDLWDKSGWKDPFSDSTYTHRQVQLALRNGQKAMFTPMAFVNGKGALPGGARGEIGKMIQTELAKPSDHYLSYSANWMADQKMLLMEYEIAGIPDSCDVFFILVEKEVQSMVTGGENKGKLLSHHNVVRYVDMNTRGTANGTSIFKFKTDDIDFTKYRLFGFLQHKSTFQILALQVREFSKR